MAEDPKTPEKMGEAEADVEKRKAMEAAEHDLIEQLLVIRKMILDSRGDKPKIHAMVLCAIIDGSQNPAVVYDGDEVSYTALAVAAATELRNRVIRKISGTL
jgi:hypothetical protein